MSSALIFDSFDFPCVRCGACCRSVSRSSVSAWLDRGDGVCSHLDEKTELCSIYEGRPDICCVKTQYIKNYQDVYSWKEFCDLNKKCCDYLQKNLA